MSSAVAVARFLSVSDIAARLNVPRHRVVYLLAVYCIPHAAIVGECKGYDDAGVEAVKRHLGSDRREAISSR